MLIVAERAGETAEFYIVLEGSFEQGVIPPW